PYYEHAGITIYHGDCREILPQLRGDVLLTDFPYAIGVEYGTFVDDSVHLNLLIKEALPLMRECCPVTALATGIGNIWRYPEPTWVLCWYQQNACSSTGKWGFNQWQPIIVYGTDPYLSNGLGRRPDVIVTNAPNNGLDKTLGHPCPKPTESWERIIARISVKKT